MDLLAEMFRYHAWATSALLGYCESLPEQRISEAVPGTLGPILPTFAHVIEVEWWMLRRLTDESPVQPGDSLSFHGLAQQAEQQRELWESILAGLPATNVPLAANPGSWPAVDHSEGLFAVHAIHHGEVHRTEVRATLSQLGVPFPGRDMNDPWAYWASAGRLQGELA